MKLTRRQLRSLILNEITVLSEAETEDGETVNMPSREQIEADVEAAYEAATSWEFDKKAHAAVKKQMGRIAGYDKVPKPIEQDKLKDVFKKAGIKGIKHQTSDTIIDVDEILDEINDSILTGSLMGEPITYEDISKAIDNLGG